jgi:signal transduction histidine kinase
VLREGALLLAVGTAMLVDGALGDGGGLTVPGGLAVLATLAVLGVRRRAPLLATVAVFAGIGACLATLEPGHTVVIPGAIVAYSVAAQGDRRRAPWLIALLVPGTVALVVGFADEGFSPDKLVSNVGIGVAAVLLGDGVRARRAARAADEARYGQADREREHDARARMAEERLRIARDVHDVVAHSIVAINVQAGVAAHLLRSRPDNAEAALLEIKRVSGSALTDLRTTLGVLRTDDDPEGTPLHPTDPLGRLDELAAPLRAAGVAVDVRVEGPVEAVPTAVGTAAFRIVQEALTNVLRHAGAASAAVRVAVTREHVSVLVTDDGGGSSTGGGSRPEGRPAAGGAGTGLRGMRERASTVGGTATAGRGPDGVWAVTARLPLPATESAT